MQDRFAVLSYILPPVDEKQDWELHSSAQKNGHTVLEFTRDLFTCDEEDDVDIKVQIELTTYITHSF